MEKWKDIEGYEGLYQVNWNGEIKALSKVVEIGNGGKRYQPEKIMKVTRRGVGRDYLCIVLYKDKKPKMHSVHRLVATAFIQNVNNHPLVMHMDDNPSNNSVSNLKWGTHSQNNRGRNQYTI
jgi:hypothetical protein